MKEHDETLVQQTYVLESGQLQDIPIDKKIVQIRYGGSNTIHVYWKSDEPVYCEWKKNILDVYQGGCTSLVVEYNDWWKFCPHCGNHIRVIEEVKPMMLDGVLPNIVDAGMGDFYANYHNEQTEESFSLRFQHSKILAIESWNDFVSRMTGEK